MMRRNSHKGRRVGECGGMLDTVFPVTACFSWAFEADRKILAAI
jgi:hypothetical protein